MEMVIIDVIASHNTVTDRGNVLEYIGLTENDMLQKFIEKYLTNTLFNNG
jgi:hypothetical protein